MESVKVKLTDFLNKCEEVKNCKFIMATTKIKDLLKSIVNSAELYELFNTVASRFDYIAAKERCFVDTDDFFGRSHIVLPDTRGDRLAFIFCLLVEIDRGDIQINAFLQKYYPKDGSYYASYHMFCEEIIGSLESIICDVFARDLAEPAPAAIEESAPSAIPQRTIDSELVGRINALSMLITRELDFIASRPLSEEDMDAAATILTRLAVAIKACDGEDVSALACGYNYFVMHTGAVSETVEMLFDEIGKFISRL